MKNINESITDIQQARAIITSVGEIYQIKVVSKLRSATWEVTNDENEAKANKVVSNMEHEYVLNVANILWKDKFDDIPDHIKRYD